MTIVKLRDLEKRYERYSGLVRCECTLRTEMVGGVPAGKDALDMFALHHLKITNPQERKKAVLRMMKEEIGSRNGTPEGGEIPEKLSYGVNIIRRTKHGPYIGNWMVKACIKQAASRLGIFTHIRGTKGNFSEAGRVQAIGVSLVEPKNPECIYLRNGSGRSPAQTYFEKFQGRVNSPKGQVSIVHDSECVAPGSRFAFEFRFLPKGVKEGDLKDLFSLAMIVGLGSCKALERGKFGIDRCEISLPK